MSGIASREAIGDRGIGELILSGLDMAVQVRLENVMVIELKCHSQLEANLHCWRSLTGMLG
jgi:hypothetical protein